MVASWSARSVPSLAAAVAQHPDRFAAFANIPVNDPKAAADELERAVDKLGMKGANMVSWVIMMGPKGMPPEIVAKLNKAINEAIVEPDVKERLLKAGIEVYPPTSTAGTGDYLKEEVARYRSYQGELGERLTK